MNPVSTTARVVAHRRGNWENDDGSERRRDLI